MRAFTLALATSLALAAPVLAEDMPTKLDVSPDITKAPAGDYALEKNHASITFKVLHMGYAYYTMRFNDFDANLTLDPAHVENSKVTATIIPASLDSHNQQLTQHTSSKDFFDVEKYPTMEFKSTKIEKTDSNHGKIYGDLTMHGVTKPVVLHATFNNGGPHMMFKKYDIGFSATTTIKRSEFGMGGYVPLVGDDVSAVIEAEFIQK